MHRMEEKLQGCLRNATLVWAGGKEGGGYPNDIPTMSPPILLLAFLPLDGIHIA